MYYIKNIFCAKNCGPEKLKRIQQDIMVIHIGHSKSSFSPCILNIWNETHRLSSFHCFRTGSCKPATLNRTAPAGGQREPVLLHSHQAAQAACQAAATAGRSPPLLHQPTHGLDALVDGHQLAQNLHVGRTQQPLQGQRGVG